ncbi:transcriptional regulator [Actinobacteria bacterium YIM 96077]|uniref:Transcriptional regulator n=1 Tax=Phytoactinopolyspora halophila TaxID=1981511 RepID=A0A329QEX1_9ACTN|nr:transcriptional regulator [Phytoactinopolyspora halophila]AYY14098.1 transcriptional regulator [Actinobacteria bacterium YIM 96077]RAW11005.1 transcriptional regulator [Phytoactinopolyspora halophila]
MDPDDKDFAKVVGARLRTLRQRKRLSLKAVEQNSGGTLRAAVVGSYERGDRAASVRRLAELADFYDVPVDWLVSDKNNTEPPPPGVESKLVLDLVALRNAPPEAEQLINFVYGVQKKRDDFGSEVLTIRANDVWVMSSVYGLTPSELREKMINWGVLVQRDRA